MSNLMPKKTRFRKVQRGRMTGRPRGSGAQVIFGEFGLQALQPAWITAQQLEAIRVTMSRKLKKVGEIFLRLFPDKAVTKKPAETRMGKGKGGVEQWVAVAKTGVILCEIKGVDEKTAREVLGSARYKLPIRTRFVKREAAQPVAEVV
jgi:large subunit ribosomal protein L16